MQLEWNIEQQVIHLDAEHRTCQTFQNGLGGKAP